MATLEVIADDTVFTPYTEAIEFANKYVVEVVTEETTNKKPSIKLVTEPTKPNNFRKALAEIITEINNRKITNKNLVEYSKTIVTIVNNKRKKYNLKADFINYSIENIPKYIK